MTATDLKKRAIALAEKTKIDSVTPEEVGQLSNDIVEYIENVEINGSSLGIRKTYTSVSAMEADSTAPKDDKGVLLRRGMLVNIYNQEDPDSADNGKVFSFQNPGWAFRGTVDAGYATKEELTELDEMVIDNIINFNLTDSTDVQTVFSSKDGIYGSFLIFEVIESTINNSFPITISINKGEKYYNISNSKGVKIIYYEKSITHYRIYFNTNPNSFSGLLNINIYSSIYKNIYSNFKNVNFLNNIVANLFFKELYFNKDIDISVYNILQIVIGFYTNDKYKSFIRFTDSSFSQNLYIVEEKKFSTFEESIEYVKSNIYNKIILFDNKIGGCILEPELIFSMATGMSYIINISISKEEVTNKLINKNIYNSLLEVNNDKKINADYFSTSVIQQNYFDDLNKTNLKEMVRSDVLVINQANLCMSENFANLYKDLRIINTNGEIDTISSGLLDDTVITDYRYFYWNEVQSSEGVYNFSVIKEYITAQVNKKHRVIIRIFPSCLSNNYTTFEKDGVTYRLSFPEYVAQKMINNGSQFVTYDANNNLLLDINDEDVYVEYNKLITNFGEWLNTEKITYGGNEIPIKEFILYIDFGLLGAWGEGQWYDLQITNTVENVLRYYNDIITCIPDVLINTGLSLENVSEKKDKTIELFYKVRQLKNNKGYFGTFLDNFGSKNPKIFYDDYIYNDKTVREWLIEFINRGDFFTGEFAMFPNEYWGGNIPTYLYNELLMFKIPHIKISNISYQYSDKVVPINNISKSIFYKINNCLSMVGFRYVYNLINYKKNLDNSLYICIELTNIGLNKCFFDIYELFYRIKNKDNDEITDIKIEFNLNDLMPKNTEPIEYSLGDGKFLESTLSELPENYSISIIGKDKYNLQSPLYFSNYGRQEDGSYLLVE